MTLERLRLARPRKRAAAALLASFIALWLAACGGGSAPSGTTAAPSPAHPVKATLVLDFVPNAVHAGIYRALAAGYYRRAGIDLQIVTPTSTADTLKLIDAGKADFGIADPIDVAGQIDRGRPARAFMALVQRPLGGVIALRSSGIRTVDDFEGDTIGITGVPSDRAVLDTVLRNAGVDPGSVQVVTIGFNGVQALENRRVQGFVGFYPADGVQVQVDGFPTEVFAFDENGGPRYPGLVVFSTERRLSRDPGLVRAFTAATVRGYEDTLRDPGGSLRDLLAQNPSLKSRLTSAQLDAYLPLFKDGAERFGVLRSGDIEGMLAFMRREGLIHHAIAVGRFGTGSFLPASP